MKSLAGRRVIKLILRQFVCRAFHLINTVSCLCDIWIYRHSSMKVNLREKKHDKLISVLNIFLGHTRSLLASIIDR